MKPSEDQDSQPLNYATPDLNVRRRDAEEYYRERPKLLDVSLREMIWQLVFVIIVVLILLALLLNWLAKLGAAWNFVG